MLMKYSNFLKTYNLQEFCFLVIFHLETGIELN